MKILLTFLAVACLTAVFLYPLFVGGLGRPVSWLLTVFLAAVGAGSLYLLVRLRTRL